MIERAQTLLREVSFNDDNHAVYASHERASAAIDYLRQRSGVIEPWLIALTSPFELRLEDDSFGGGDGLLLEFGELPPGLDDLGECAVVDIEEGDCASWLLRPAMASFDTELELIAGGQVADCERLREIGFTEGEIKRLDRIARQVAQCYASLVG